ncbi:MAG: DUF4350 domain-containing protein [Verrucomicrobiota bacterium]
MKSVTKMVLGKWGRGFALGILVFLGSGCREGMVKEEVELGYRGEARVNPLLAAERFLTGMGLEASRQFSLTELPDPEVVMMVPRSAIEGTNEAWRVLSWAELGGHLIYIHQDQSSFLGAWNARSEPENEEEIVEKKKPSETGSPLLDCLSITVKDRKRWTRTIRIKGEKLEVSLPKGAGFKVDPEWMLQGRVIKSGGDSGYSFASFPYGDGRLTLLSDSYPWRNRYVGDKDHAEFLWRVVTLQSGAAAVWLLRSAHTSFWALLWKYGWMPLLSLFVFLIFWLWRGIPRFGPRLPSPEAAPREFVSHLALSGGFLWTHRSVEPLLGPIRRRILRRYQQKTVAFGEPDFEKMLASLSESSGLPLEKVRNAMLTETVKRAERLKDLLRDLQKIDLSQ